MTNSDGNIGQTSPDGGYVWDGQQWVPRAGGGQPGPGYQPQPGNQPGYAGPPPKQSHTLRNVLLVLLGLLILGVGGCTILASAFVNEVDKTIEESEAKDKEPGSLGDSAFKDGVLTTPELKIRITRYKVIRVGQKGNEYGEKPVIALWYKITNLSGAKVDPTTDFILNFHAYQDNNPNAENELDVGSLPDDRFLDSQTENIKKGGTVENAIAYELDDLRTSVDLVATEGLDEVIGKATYKLK